MCSDKDVKVYSQLFLKHSFLANYGKFVVFLSADFKYRSMLKLLNLKKVFKPSFESHSLKRMFRRNTIQSP